jgi:hypothetical protein
LAAITTRLRKRLERLERKATRTPRRPENLRLCEEEWFECLSADATTGYFENEPGFPAALAAFGEAQAAARNDRVFEPPPDFRPDLPLGTRRVEWRQGLWWRFELDRASVETLNRLDQTFIELLTIVERVEEPGSPS